MRGGLHGYTLVELVVAMLIFSVVMTVISASFNRIVTSSAQASKNAETDIGGLIGLEVLRIDLESAGMGLPWSLPAGIAYRETCLGKIMVDGYPGTKVDIYEDVDPVSKVPRPPRAVASGDNAGMNGSDYLVLKGSALGMSTASQGWSYLTWGAAGAVVKPSKSATELVPGNGDRAVVLKSEVTGQGPTRTLVATTVSTGEGTSSSASPVAFTLHFNTPIPQDFTPSAPEDRFLVYGIARRDDSGKLVPLSYPYNRADYFIKSSPLNDGGSPLCARGTGTLYKTVISQNSDRPAYYPLLDCVADLQVIYLLDNGYHVSDLGEGLQDAASAEEVRERVKEIRLYLLAQQGKREPAYRYPLDDLPLVVGDPALDRGTGKVLGSRWGQQAFALLTPDWRQYHWKVYTIVVQPKNF
ncbi:prepilin-type N-terminal cleavage/methylation domain-containing protein [Geomonas sp. Red32]|uniref:PulJ/GspJ family protein n=1 Tax=Geomonas sp. Red32 TaxID=2912856 RepID=UPI00202CA9A5|nr:prepilin-type N-terminal cleavage/methylation domain-containing protein [Geomonas sp. Red32]MCM0083689.1 prepilin-type N-terminal cleavage/methylation domain-containing protein [Geomonas sp. Red32]